MRDEITPEEIQAAEQRWEHEVGCYPFATAAHFDHNWRRVIVTLSTGLEIALLPQRLLQADGATDDALSEIEIAASGYELFFPLLDDGIWLPNTFRDSFPKLRAVGDRSDQSDSIAA